MATKKETRRGRARSGSTAAGCRKEDAGRQCCKACGLKAEADPLKAGGFVSEYYYYGKVPGKSNAAAELAGAAAPEP